MRPSAIRETRVTFHFRFNHSFDSRWRKVLSKKALKLKAEGTLIKLGILAASGMEFKKSSRVLEKSLGKVTGKGDLAMLASRSNNGVVPLRKWILVLRPGPEPG